MVRKLLGLLLSVLLYPLAFVAALFAPPADIEMEMPCQAADDRESIANVKRWAAAMLRGEEPCPDGKYRFWLRGLNLECAAIIAHANVTGCLEAHLGYIYAVLHARKISGSVGGIAGVGARTSLSRVYSDEIDQGSAIFKLVEPLPLIG